MNIHQIPMTGSEDITKIQESELQALSQFYNAFNNRNIELMQDVWLNTEESSMDNPIGGIRRGWSEILSGYEKIFNGRAEVYVEFYDYSLHTTADMFFVTGRERGHFKIEGTTIDLAIRTSRIFTKREEKWKQIHHHGSIDDPGLLKEYQHAVRK